jgi:hypothetical protein
VAFPLACPLATTRFCSADVDEVPFAASGVWLPLAIEGVSAAALRFLPLVGPFAVALLAATDNVDCVDG